MSAALVLAALAIHVTPPQPPSPATPPWNTVPPSPPMLPPVPPGFYIVGEGCKQVEEGSHNSRYCVTSSVYSDSKCAALGQDHLTHTRAPVCTLGQVGSSGCATSVAT